MNSLLHHETLYFWAPFLPAATGVILSLITKNPLFVEWAIGVALLVWCILFTVAVIGNDL